MGHDDGAGTAPSPSTARVVSLYRYPLKGFSPEPVDEVALTPGDGVPGDRMFALARPETEFSEDSPAALPKTRFVMLQKDEAIARIRTSYDPATGVLAYRLDEAAAGNDRGHGTGGGGGTGDEGGTGDGGDGVREPRRADLGSAEGRAAFEDFVGRLVGPGLGGRPRLVAARRRHRFTDVGGHGDLYMHALSVINLASVRDLAERVGEPIDPLRFRANIYVDGLRPWAELGWVDLEFGLGQVRVRMLARTPRCAATTVNPATGVRDIRILKELSSNYGHTDCGIYVTVLAGATLRPGDPLTAPDGHEEALLCGS